LKRFARFIKNFDWIIFTAAVLLLAFSVAIIFSTTFSMTGNANEALQQLGYAVIGLVALFVLARVDYRTYKNYSGILYLVTIIMLVSVHFFGTTSLGATRWIKIGFFQFQPSEMAKLFMIIIMAKFFSEHAQDIYRLKTVLKSLLFVGIPTILVILQPDLGTGLTFIIIWASMYLVSSARKIYLLGFAAAAAAFSPIVYKFFLHDYQRQRLLTFFNPANDPMGSGWNVNQAMIAIGSGQWLGRGLGHGPQSQLNFVPFKHTDFVFAALSEEMGFVGALAVLVLFGVIMYRAIRIAMISRDHFGMFMATGIFAVLFFHVVINIGMNIGIMPVTGIPLPLVSSGGTSIVITLASLGILESIIIRYKKIDF
jgi:rod shape determining protein RodA